MLALEGKKVRLSHTRKSLKYEGRQTTWGEQGGNGAMDNASRKTGITHDIPEQSRSKMSWGREESPGPPT